jgi:hypothetical protein
MVLPEMIDLKELWYSDCKELKYIPKLPKLEKLNGHSFNTAYMSSKLVCLRDTLLVTSDINNTTKNYIKKDNIMTLTAELYRPYL